MLVKDYIKKHGNIHFQNVLTEKGKEKLHHPKWIITDMRFPNEMDAVKAKGGITIRVNRPRYCEGCTLTNLESQDCFDCIIYQEDYHNMHPSETSLDGAHFDYVIDNNGSIQDLIQKVTEILIKEKII